MFVPFDSLPEESKIWIYQSNRKFSDEEIQEIEKDLTSFLEDWSAHGQQLEASFITKYNLLKIERISVFSTQVPRRRLICSIVNETTPVSFSCGYTSTSPSQTVQAPIF